MCPVYTFTDPFCGFVFDAVRLFFLPLVLGAVLPIGGVVLVLRCAMRRIFEAAIWKAGSC